MTLLNYENIFLARLRFNTTLAYLVHWLQTIFQMKSICGKTLVFKETWYGPPVLSPAASVASFLLPALYITSVKQHLPPGCCFWHLRLSPTFRLSPLFPTDKHVTNSSTSNLCYNIAFSLKLQPWSSSGPLHPPLFIFSKHLT